MSLLGAFGCFGYGVPMSPMSDDARVQNLNQAQEQAWHCQQPLPATSREALGRLLEIMRGSLEAYDAGQVVPAQTALEDSLIQLLIAMKTFSLQPDAALQRALERLQTASSQRAFHIFSDRVEIRAQGEVRGTLPLDSESDYESALQLARELGCDVIHEEASQLELFRARRPAE